MDTHALFSAPTLPRQDELLDIARRVIANGYEPVPVLVREKRPLITNWSCRYFHDPVDMSRFARQLYNYPDHKSIGFLTRKLPSVDLDLRNDEHNAVLREIVEQHFGVSPLKRFGSKGMMLSYNLADGETALGKIVIKTKRTGDNPKAKTLVELFGAGGQFVGYGVHPSTQAPYRWLVPGAEPVTVRRLDLPAVTPAMIVALRDNLTAGLVALGYEVESVDTPVYREPIEPQNVPAALVTTTTKSGEIDYPQLFLNAVRSHAHSYKPSGWIDLHHCPACWHDDRRDGGRAGLRLVGAGFEFHCHHASCPYNRTTGWQPGRPLGEREKQLYEMLGGDLQDFVCERDKQYLADAEETRRMIVSMRNKNCEPGDPEPDDSADARTALLMGGCCA